MATTEISASVVMKLRDRTGLSMMECKKALVEAAGDMDKAEDVLRKKLKGKMDSKEARATGEGRIAIAVGPSSAAIVELRANTDFTAKNEQFVALAQKLADGALSQPAGDVQVQGALAAAIDDLRIKTGEQIALARGAHVAGGGGAKFAQYVHHDGKKGVLIKFEGSAGDELMRQIGMHVIAAVPTPKGVSSTDIPAEVVEKERKFRIEQAIESGKPKEIAEKMVEGGMRKFFEEIALLEQPFVVDPSKKIKDLLGTGTKVIGFWRWAVGE